MTRPATFAFTGGPNAPLPAVAAALAVPLPSHSDPAFLDLFRQLERDAATIMRWSGDLLIFQAEGVVALEAATASLVGPGRRVMNLVNGVFGHALGEAMRALGATVHDVSFPFDEAVDPEVVERELRAHGDTELLTVCHVETPGGIVNPLHAIAEAANRHGAATFVDAVASVGADPIDVAAWGLDVVVAAPHKAIGATPGLSFITVSDRAWALIEGNNAAPRRSILSLLEWRDAWLRDGHFPFTPSVADVVAAHAACGAVLEVGVAAWVGRHRVASAAAREGALAMGLELWPRRSEHGAGAATAIRLPAATDAATVVEHARARYDVLLSGSYVGANVVRIGHMGTASRSISVVLALGALGRTLLDRGIDVRVGSGLEAALEAYADGLP